MIRTLFVLTLGTLILTAQTAHAQEATPCRDAHDAILEIRILQSDPRAQDFGENSEKPEYAAALALYTQGIQNLEAGNFPEACTAFRQLKSHFGIEGTGNLQLSKNTCTEASIKDRYIQAATTRRSLAWQENPESPEGKQAAAAFENAYNQIESFVSAGDLKSACDVLTQLESYAGVQ